MAGRLRSIGRDLVVYGLGEVLVKAFGFVTLPVYTHLFSPDEYGVYGYATTLVALASAILILGGDSAYARFYFATANDVDRRRLTSTWIGFLGAVATVAVAASVPFAPTLAVAAFGDASFATLVIAAVISVPVGIVNRMCAQVLRNQFRAVAYTVLNLVGMALTVGLSITGALVLDLGITGLFVGALAAELLLLPVRLVTVRSMFGLQFSPSVLRSLLAYGLPLVPMSVAYWVFLTSDRIVLGELSGLTQVGLYSVAVTLVSVPSVAINAVGQAWSPHAMAAYEADEALARHLVARVASFVLAGFGLLAVGITAFAPEVVAVLSTNRYAPAAAAVPPLALAMVAQASTSVTALGMSLRKRTTHLATMAWMAALVNVALNLVLDPAFGMIGAAWATLAAYASLTVAYHAVSQRLWAVPYDRRGTAIVLAAVAFFTLAAPLLPSPGLILAILVKGAWCVGFILVVVGLQAVDLSDTAGWVRSRLAQRGSAGQRASTLEPQQQPQAGEQ